MYSAYQDSDEGELSIAIPSQVSLRASSASMPGIQGTSSAWQKPSAKLILTRPFTIAATPEPHTPGGAHAPNATEFAPIIINIAYMLRNPADGFQFVLPSDAHPYVSSIQAGACTSLTICGFVACSALLYHPLFTRCCSMLGSVHRQHLGEIHLGVRDCCATVLGGGGSR